MGAFGFTPYQVVAVFALQIVMPALAACLVGVTAGTLASQPLLANSSHALGLAYTPTFSIGLDLLLFAGGILVVAVAPAGPPLRAGLLKPIVAITKASPPRGAGGHPPPRPPGPFRLPTPACPGLGDP